MRLLPKEAFSEVFEPLQGKRIGYIRNLGNAGDQLIEAATFQLMDEFEIDWRIQNPCGPVEVDELLFCGGGNMGTLYRSHYESRRRLLLLGRPMTILPQTFSSREDRPFKRVFVRERGSLRYCPCAILAPDLALGLDYWDATPPVRDLGVFIRRDREQTSRRPWLARDPAKMCRTGTQYIQLAARYCRIITDRLHFAIAALIMGRDTTLLPNSYHKNKSVYETWLKKLGCKFAETLEEAKARTSKAA